MKSILIMGLISIVALSLRLWHIDWSGPYDYNWDEVTKRGLIARKLGNEGGLRYFKHPHFLLTSSAMLVRINETISGPMSERETALLSRHWVALLGAATVFATGLLGYYWRGPLVGIVSALLLAVFPLHVLISRYIKEDIGVTLWLVLACGATIFLQDVKRRKLGFFILGSAVGGVLSAKWVGALVLIPVIYEIRRIFRMEQTAAAERRRLRWLFVAGIVIQFLIWNPTVFQDWFYLGRDMARGVEQGGWRGDAGIHAFGIKYLFLWHYTHSLLPGMGLTAAVMGVVGLFSALRKHYSHKGWLIGLFAVIFYFSAEFSPLKATLNSERYMAVVLPFLALLAAAATGQFAAWMTQKARKPGLTFASSAILVALMITPSLANTVAFSRQLSNDTRTVARQWILNTLPHGSVIAHVGSPYYFPQQLDEAGIKLVPLSLKPYATNASPEAIRAGFAGFDYLLVTSFHRFRSQRWPKEVLDEAAFYQEVFEHYPLVKSFESVDPAILWPDFSRPIQYGFNQPTLWIFKLPRP